MFQSLLNPFNYKKTLRLIKALKIKTTESLPVIVSTRTQDWDISALLSDSFKLINLFFFTLVIIGAEKMNVKPPLDLIYFRSLINCPIYEIKETKSSILSSGRLHRTNNISFQIKIYFS